MILNKIVATKKIEVAQLYQQYDIDLLRNEAVPSSRSFYDKIEAAAQAGTPFLISEFKRKSPSEGWINKEIAISKQLDFYKKLGASAVSILTDYDYFGGSHKDLKEASDYLKDTDILVLNKEFIIDEIQLYLARKNGANLVLLIAAILDTEQFSILKNLAESLGMGVLAEVHSIAEYQKIADLNCTVIGVNNRDLNTFKTALNNCNFIAHHINHKKYFIAESGMHSAFDLSVAGTYSHGFLIGTSLMRKPEAFTNIKQNGYFLKACGLRKLNHFKEQKADLVGINFSPISKRKISPEVLLKTTLEDHYVALFYKNNKEEISTTLEKHSFKYVQLYAKDVSLELVKSLKQKILLAISIQSEKDLLQAEAFAPYIDCFILDGAQPGQGKTIAAEIPKDFPYPFLLAGGINAHNLNRVLDYKNCIGVDVASGIETNGEVDLLKIEAITNTLKQLPQS